jgi:hypothetical protein
MARCSKGPAMVALCCLSLSLLAVDSADSAMLGFARLQVDFSKPKTVKGHVSWAPKNKLRLGKKGLGWSGSPRASYQGHVLSRPIAIGVSWRPARSVNVRLEIGPAPGSRPLPYHGQAYARFSPDKRHWSSWQALTSKKLKTGPRFSGSLGVPHNVSARYDALRMKYNRRKNVPWSSDEEALVASIVKRNPNFFRNYKPFIGYVQVLWEGSIFGDRPIARFDVSLAYAVSGLHTPARDKRALAKHKGTWRFVDPRGARASIP